MFLNFRAIRASGILLLISAVAFARPVTELTSQDTLARSRAFSVIAPVEGHTRLSVSEEGLDVLRKISGPVVPVIVIGPYRSGKSFLLNQLLGVGCDAGFGVGHSRSTQTRGVWLWGEPLVVRQGNRDLSLVLFDTEGFESTGKADAYDDRIFALSALLSAVLIYNLPETVRESDIEKLSFAVQLADNFYSHAEGVQRNAPLAPANMLWLIQRDFLEGKTVQAMVKEALQPVPNPGRDADIEQVNRIRTSLTILAQNSTAFGLRQPHLQRTQLCQLADSDLDPVYVQQRSELRTLVFSLAKPKVVSGQEVTGTELADLLVKMVGALNSQDIPSAGSILEHFNRELVAKVRETYAAALEAVPLPVPQETLDVAATLAKTDALNRFHAQRFGSDTGPAAEALQQSLEAGLAKELAVRQSANALASVRICDAAEAACEATLEREQQVILPSTTRFAASFQECRAAFVKRCVGPGAQAQADRLDRAWEREGKRFHRDYNDKLFNGLLGLTFIDIVVFRFVVKISLMETIGWLGFAFLQIYPKLYVSGSMYTNAWWQALVAVWEAVVASPLRWILPALVISLVVYRLCGARIRRRLQLRGDKALRLGSLGMRDLAS
ncbi:hypothetical protein WJX73_001870 [Symbiochloris irregularis]|uniref:GB1/RHD3-type G domain-containing protein n=1 Tax=Symbiochloris irregularis TaxID=706552 RepID=A0AAW1PN41_9CHLO